MKKSIKIKNKDSTIAVMYAIIFTFLAKGIGFCRELITASIFGTSSLADAFVVAFSIPDILSSGFSIAIATLYIPTFYKIKKESNNKEVINQFNTSILILLIILSCFLIVFVELFPEFIVNIFASGFEKTTIRTTVSIIKIMILSVFPILLSSFFCAYGQIKNKFQIITLMSSLINIIIIFSLLIFKKNNIHYIAWSVFLGNTIYLIIVYYIIKKEGFKFSSKFNLNNSYLKGMLFCIFPVFISNIVGQISQVIDKNFASQLAVGTVSALNYSSKIINLITAVLGTAISGVLFANLSKKSMDDSKLLLKEIKLINKNLLILLMPIFYIVLVFSESIVRILFGRGGFGNESIKITSECLMYYSMGIIGFNFKSIWVRIYNASLDTKTPAINSCMAVIFNIIFNIIFVKILGHKGLALATSLSSVLTSILLMINYKKININFNINILFKEFIKIFIASLVYIPILIFTKQFISNNLFNIVFLIMISVGISTIIYFILLNVLFNKNEYKLKLGRGKQ